MVSKKFLILFLVIISGCSNPPAPKEKPLTNESLKEHKKPAVRPPAAYWTISSFAAKDGNTEGSKFIRFVTEGHFTDTIHANKYLYAEVLMNKKNAGIFLHKLKKTSPVEQFDEPVGIKMTSSSGQEI